MYAPFRANTSGNNDIVAASAGQSIYVFGIFLQANALTSFKLKDGHSGSDLTGQMTFTTGGGLNLQDFGVVLFQTSVGEPLTLAISSLLGDVGGAIIYQYA